MFKKLIILSTILASGSAIAFSGTPYIGGSLGVNQQTFKLEDKTEPLDVTFNSGGTGAIFNINGGYGTFLTPTFYLGAELLANGTSSNVKATDISIEDGASSELKLKTKYSYGASIIPGILLSEKTMGYARVGIVRTRFQVDSNASIDDLSVNSQQKDNVTGGQFGLGLQTKLTEKVDLRGEYSYSKYHSFDAMGLDVNPSSGQATVGLVYKIQ